MREPHSTSRNLENWDDEDIWLSPRQGRPDTRCQYRTWDGFDGPHDANQAITFMTEAGPDAFDALLAVRSQASKDGDAHDLVVDTASYFACLLNLAMGRGSPLFSWQPEKRSFVQAVPRAKVSGYSTESLAGIRDMCTRCGNAARSLRSFVDKTFSSVSIVSASCRVALAGAVDKQLMAVQAELGIRGRKVRSMLQLQSAVRPVLALMSYFDGLVKELGQSKTDEQILSALFEEAQAVEYKDIALQELVRDILDRVSKPWTDFVQQWIGTKAEEGLLLTKHGPGKGFVKVVNKAWVDDQGYELEEPEFSLDEDKMPSFMPQDIARALFESGRNLRFLRANHPDHILLDPRAVGAAHPPELRWQFHWDDISRAEEEANQYEASICMALQKEPGVFRRAQSCLESSDGDHDRYKWQIFGNDAAQIEANILASIRSLDTLPSAQPDKLTDIVRGNLSAAKKTKFDDFGTKERSETSPHWALLPILSFGPLVAAQARIVDRECTKLLFSCHGLRTHLCLQKQYHLFGNGVFCGQLSHSLFDPDLDTAERRAGVALTGGNMGLRLSGRDHWPPASSELRLALMGVLAESYQRPALQATPATTNTKAQDRSLPGDISFGLRDLSAKEIDRCMDPNSLEALDFLRLTYKPPACLQTIMVPGILQKYDRLFQLLLRVQRMLYVTKQLYMDHMRSDEHKSSCLVNRRFCAEANHFVVQIATYFFDTGIERPWRRFELWLDGVENGLAQPFVKQDQMAGTRDAQQGIVVGPDQLREKHEQVLDEIMRTLLLRKRQLPVLLLLEEVFGVVLQFAKGRRRRTRGRAGAEEGTHGCETTEALYAAFRKKVEVFIMVCRGLAEKSRSAERRGGRRDDDGEGSIEQLVAMLDLSGYYGKKAHG